MTDKNILDMKPKSSITMDILMKIDEKNIGNELQTVGELLDSGMNKWHLEQILGSKYSSDLKAKNALLNGLKSGRAKLNDQDFEKFTRDLYTETAYSDYYDEKLNSFVPIKEEERPSRINSVFEHFGIEADIYLTSPTSNPGG